MHLRRCEGTSDVVSDRALGLRALGVPDLRVSNGLLNRVSPSIRRRVGAGQRVARSSERGEIRIGARDLWQRGREQRFKKPCINGTRFPLALIMAYVVQDCRVLR